MDKPRFSLTIANAKEVRTAGALRALAEYYDGTVAPDETYRALQLYGYSERQIDNLMRRTGELWLEHNDAHRVPRGAAA